MVGRVGQYYYEFGTDSDFVFTTGLRTTVVCSSYSELKMSPFLTDSSFYP